MAGTVQSIKELQAQTMTSLAELKKREAVTAEGLKQLVSELQEDEDHHLGSQPSHQFMWLWLLTGLGLGVLGTVVLAAIFIV